MSNFKQEVSRRVAAQGRNATLQDSAAAFLRASISSQYSYNWFWLGRPIIQYPQDICAVQELIWDVKPDLIIETGIAHGGSLMLSASLMAMLDLNDAFASHVPFDPRNVKRKVLAVDIEIRPHNRAAIDAHFLAPYIQMIEGSSVSVDVVTKVADIAREYQRIMVFLDSNHTHQHVLGELEAFAPLVSAGSYCVVFDTLIEDLPAGTHPDRPWGPGDNPKTAVREFLRNHPEFEQDLSVDQRLLISVASEGYLKRK